MWNIVGFEGSISHTRGHVNMTVEIFVGIGERLKEERLRLGMNQTDFAVATGVTKNSQFNYEKGDRNPDTAYLTAAGALGVDVFYVLTGRRAPQSADLLAEDETEMLGYYRALPATDKANVRRMSHALAETAGVYRTKKTDND